MFDIVKCFAFFVGGERGRILNESDERLSFNDPVDGLVVQGGSMVKETKFFACRRPGLAWGPCKIEGDSFDVGDDNVGKGVGA